MKRPDPSKNEPSIIKLHIAARISDIQHARESFRFTYDPNFSEKMKLEEKAVIDECVERLETIANLLIPYIKKVKAEHIQDITETSTVCAVYLLFCHVLETWQVVFILAKNSFNTQMMDLVRHIREATDLIVLFTHEGDGSEILGKWFDGEIIPHSKSRKKAVSRLKEYKVPSHGIDLYSLQAYIYSILSQATHSAYYPILESVNIFDGDFDFDRCSSTHFTKENLRFVSGVMNATIITLKAIFGYLKDRASYEEVDALLRQVHTSPSRQQMKGIAEMFPKQE